MILWISFGVFAYLLVGVLIARWYYTRELDDKLATVMVYAWPVFLLFGALELIVKVAHWLVVAGQKEKP